ncbi:unnamed protein product, partial [Anisakis simplex]|uniref:Uncharacterized protein n=1 Tax=Anisakis simplex TaxID=6269 RepID=A0A0M3JLY7_ANISI
MFVFALIPSPASRAGHRDGSSRDGWDGGPP